jgi:hypothetical protein
LPTIASGFYRDRYDPSNAFECTPKDACPKTSSTSSVTACNDGYTGFICGACESFLYYKIGSNCAQCPSLEVKIISFLAIIFAGIFIVWKISQIKNFEKLADYRALLFWIQILAYFPRFSSSWPQELQLLFQIVSVFNLDIELIAPECSLTFGFWEKYYFKLSLPLVVVSLYLSRWVFLSRKNGIVISVGAFFEKLSYVFTVISSIFYTIIFATVISPFHCVAHFDGSYALWYDSTIMCFEGNWNSVHYGPIIIFCIIYVIIFPVIIFREYYRGRTFQKDLNELKVGSLYNYLVKPYRSQVKWWEILLILKRVTIILSGSLIPGSGPGKYFLLFLVFLGFLLLDIAVFPYERKTWMKICMLWNSTALFILMFDGLFFRSETVLQFQKDVCTVLAIVLVVLITLGSIIQLYRNRYEKSWKKVFPLEIGQLDNSVAPSISAKFIPDDEFIAEFRSGMQNIHAKVRIQWENKNNLINRSAARSALDIGLVSLGKAPKSSDFADGPC